MRPVSELLTAADAFIVVLAVGLLGGVAFAEATFPLGTALAVEVMFWVGGKSERRRRQGMNLAVAS